MSERRANEVPLSPDSEAHALNGRVPIKRRKLRGQPEETYASEAALRLEAWQKGRVAPQSHDEWLDSVYGLTR